MEFPDLSPLTKNMCRTCLAEVDTNLVGLQDYIAFEQNPVRLIDVLSFIGCVEGLEDNNWPQGICDRCASSAYTAYNFKIHCEKSTKTLLKILTSTGNSSPNLPEIDPIDILSFIHQDHEYELPFFSNTEANIIQNLTITPLPIPTLDEEHKEFVPEIIMEEPEEKEKQEPKEKLYSCPVCQSSFTRIYGLKYHMDKHELPNGKLCQKCGKGFGTTGLLRQHQLTHNSAKFKCKCCIKSYKTKQALKQHFRVAHSANRYSFPCNECNKVFTAKATLLSHINTHKSNRKLFPCPYCPKLYFRNSTLRVHLEMHTTEGKSKKFFCTYSGCNKRYATKHCLELHISFTHSNNRPFVCEICSKSFVTKSNLVGHKKTHDNSACNICGIRLLNKTLLRNHLKDHNK